VNEPPIELPPLVDFVCARLAEACHMAPRRVRPDSSLVQLRTDSLTLLSVLTQVESAYGLCLPAEDSWALFEAADVNALVRLIETRAEPVHIPRNSSNNET
jgi:acyl carrier protein